MEAKTWALCTPENVAEPSAVAYFFARDLYQKMNVPIGMVESFWGGTAAESWTSLHSLAADASLMPVFAERSKTVDEQEATLLRLQREEREFQQAEAQAKAENKPVPGRPLHPDFAAWVRLPLYLRHDRSPDALPIRGVIWITVKRIAATAHRFMRIFFRP